MLAIAAAVAVLASVGALWWSQRGVEMEVVKVSDAPSSGWVAGQKLRARQLALVRGSSEVRLSSGVSLQLTAPVEVQFVSAMHVRVVAGKVTGEAFGKKIAEDYVRLGDVVKRAGIKPENILIAD